MPNALLQLAREYPGLFAVMAVVGVAGLLSMYLDYRGAKRQRPLTDEQKLERRNRERLRLVNEQYENDHEPRLHWWR